MKVEPDHVYVIPLNTDLMLSQGTLRLAPRMQHRGPHPAMDLFFRSLAQDRHHQAIGVLLSGTASDGTQGLQAIKAQGGMTFAQDEQSAAYPQMPQHAIAAGCVDRILPPEEIASALMTLNRRPSLAPIPSLETRMLLPSEQLVLFEEALPQMVADPASPGSPSGKQDLQRAAAIRIAALEQELAASRIEVQAILQEHDGVNDRLQATNEEIRSSNEELQRLNEELTTANQQLQTLNEQLRVSQEYAESIVETIREPLVVLM